MMIVNKFVVQLENQSIIVVGIYHGGVHGAMVSITGNEHGFKSWMKRFSHCNNTIGKGMNPIILLQAMENSRRDWAQLWDGNWPRRRKT